ncbi:MAG: ABC transporter permease [Acinetobacter sp.]
MRLFFKYYVQTFKNIAANSSILTTLILGVIIYGFFYPTAYQAQKAEALPIIIVDEERSELSQSIIQAVSYSPNVEIKQITGNFLTAEQQVKNQKAEAILYLPHNLSQSLMHGETGGIGFYLSAAYFVKLKDIALGMGTAIEHSLAEQLEKFGQISHFKFEQSIHSTPLFNPLSGYASYIFPAVSPLIIHQTILIGLSMLIASYREKFWQPSATEFFATFASVLTIGCIGCLYYFGFIFWLYDLPRGGNFWGMCLAIPIYISYTVAFSMLLASFFDMLERAGHVLVVTSIPIFLLSGVAFPHESMPVLIQYLAWFLPTTSGLHMFIQLNQMGVPTWIVIPKLLYIGVFGLVCLALAYYRLVIAPRPASQ